jgi:mannose-1-phosphate guanylyltransferase/mannose-6-phosphate isomerase
MPNLPAESPLVAEVTRPWGCFKQYAHNQPVTVSLMTVEPDQRLSLQSHANRAELWVALDDGAAVQVGEEVLHPAAGDEVWIPKNTQHRLSSLGRRVRMLEVAFGDWQQDDIVRYADDYQRPARGE